MIRRFKRNYADFITLNVNKAVFLFQSIVVILANNLGGCYTTRD